MVALGLVVFVGFLAFGIDLGQMYVVRNDLQNAADAAALAGAAALVQDVNNDGVAEFNPDLARTAAKDCANKNRSLGAPAELTVADADVVIGRWDLATKTLDTNAAPNQVNAVQVTVRRTGADNPQVQTFLGNALGAGDKKDVEALATAFLDVAGTSSSDIPFAIPYHYVAGGGVAANGWQRVLDQFAPSPAYAATKQYQWKDLGGNNPVRSDRATFVVPTQGEQNNTVLKKYIWGADMPNGKRFPQKKVGDQLWPMSEWKWGSYIKPTFQALKDRFNDPDTVALKRNGKWRVTVPVFNTTQVTSVPQNSWFKLASRLLPGVSQAYACTAYSPAVYNHGFAAVDVTNVYVHPTCNQYTDQVTDPNSCRNKCYMDIEVPLDQNTLSTDKASTPAPYTKDYQDMNPAASEVGVFSAIPKIVK